MGLSAYQGVKNLPFQDYIHLFAGSHVYILWRLIAVADFVFFVVGQTSQRGANTQPQQDILVREKRRLANKA